MCPGHTPVRARAELQILAAWLPSSRLSKATCADSPGALSPAQQGAGSFPSLSCAAPSNVNFFPSLPPLLSAPRLLSCLYMLLTFIGEMSPSPPHTSLHPTPGFHPTIVCPLIPHVPALRREALYGRDFTAYLQA